MSLSAPRRTLQHFPVFHGLAAVVAFALCAAPSLSTAQPAPELSKEDSRSARIHFQTGRAYFTAKQYERAIVEFEAARSLVKLPAFTYNIGLCHEKLGQFEMALDEYENYISIAPPPPDVQEVAMRIVRLRTQLEKSAKEAPSPDAPPEGSATPDTPAEEASTATAETTTEPSDVAPPTEEEPTASGESGGEPAPAADPGIAPEPTGHQPMSTGQRLRPYILPAAIGAGAVVLTAIGAGLLGAGVARHNDLASTCGRPVGMGCPADQVDRAQGLYRGGAALLSIGVVAAAADVALWIYMWKTGKLEPRVTIAPTFGGATVRGRF